MDKEKQFAHDALARLASMVGERQAYSAGLEAKYDAERRDGLARLYHGEAHAYDCVIAMITGMQKAWTESDHEYPLCNTCGETINDPALDHADHCEYWAQTDIEEFCA